MAGSQTVFEIALESGPLLPLQSVIVLPFLLCLHYCMMFVSCLYYDAIVVKQSEHNISTSITNHNTSIQALFNGSKMGDSAHLQYT